MAQFSGRTWTWTERSTGDTSPNDSYTTDSLRLTRQLFIDPGTIEARYDAAKTFLGFPDLQEVRDSNNILLARYVSRRLPQVATWTDNDNALICTSVSWQQGVRPGVRNSTTEPWNDAQEVNEYAATEMQVEYRSTNYEIAEDTDCVENLNRTRGAGIIRGFFARLGLQLPDEGLMLRYIDRTWRYAGDVFSIPANYTAFLADAGEAFNPLPNIGGYPFWEPKIEYTYVHRELPLDAVPIKAIANCLNTMNAAVMGDNPGNFDPPFWNLPTFTLLFTGCTPHIGKLITGEVGVNMEYKFLYAPNIVRYGASAGTFGGWRRALTLLPPGSANAGKVDYREVHPFLAPNAAADFCFRSTDFSTLFRPDQT